MPGKVEKKTPGEQIVAYSGLALIFISLITFLYLLYPLFSNPGEIAAFGDKVSGFSGLAFNSSTIFAITFLILFITLFAVVSLFYSDEKFSMGFTEASNRKFYGYLMIYILVQLVLSEFISYFAPGYANEFPFNKSGAVQSFVLSYQTLLEAALYELLPITIAAVIISKLHGTPLSQGIRFYRMTGMEKHIVSAIIALAASFLVSVSIVTLLTAFFSLFVLNEIFLNFGFLKAYLTNFAVALFNVTAYLVQGNTVLSFILPLFLFFLGFLGVYSLFQVGVRIPTDNQGSPMKEMEEGVQEAPKAGRIVSQIEPFVRSRCPQCGQATYHILLPNMNMQCAKCGHEMDRDAVGEINIVIDARNPSRF